MKDDFLMIKKFIEDKKGNLKRKCVLDPEETPAKKLKNYKNSNEIPEKEEGKECNEKSKISKNLEETLINFEPKEQEVEVQELKYESPKKDNDNIIEESMKMSSNNIKITNSTTNNKKDNKFKQKVTIVNNNLEYINKLFLE
jgi:hypothetical protein